MSAEEALVRPESSGDSESDFALRSLVAGLNIFAGKWKLPILWNLEQRPHLFGELSTTLSGISSKVLTYQLRELERDGLICRGSGSGLRFYALTTEGLDALNVVHTIRHWGTWWLDRFDQSDLEKRTSRSLRTDDPSSTLWEQVSGWKLGILTHLQNRTRTFGELWSLLVGISVPELTNELTDLMNRHLVKQELSLHGQQAYSLTDTGVAAAVILKRLLGQAISRFWWEASQRERSTLQTLFAPKRRVL